MKSKYADILWVDDFDMNDSSDIYVFLPDYFPNDRHFRVHVEKYFLSTLQHLENNFSNYSCAVLDIDLTQGFELEIMDTEEEEEAICNILQKHHVLVGSGTSGNTLSKEFKRNAGYYLYLYLLQRGMPGNRIVMLTGNKGDSNLSGAWDTIFRNSHIEPPAVFDKKECQLKNGTGTSIFTDWLKSAFSSPYQLRSCMIAMTSCVQDMLLDKTLSRDILCSRNINKSMWDEGEDRSFVIENMYPRQIPLRLPDEPGEACKSFIPFIWQLSSSWEAAKPIYAPYDSDYAYYTVMKTARNWLAHHCIKSLRLQTCAFLLGIGLRGMFNFPCKASANSNLRYYDDYIAWENELISLIRTLDEMIDVKSQLGYPDELVINSNKEFYKRTRSYFANGFTPDIINILKVVGDKSKRPPCYEEDLLRAFLHSIYYLYATSWISEDRYAGVQQLSFTFKIDSRCKESTYHANDRNLEYLQAIKNRLIYAVTHTLIA